MAQIPGTIRRPLCARPGCQGDIVAWLTYDYAGQRVWLDDARSEAGDQWGMCTNHASRLSPPQGWVMVDRRVVRPGRYEPPATLVS
jgi:hypothetical protein